MITAFCEGFTNPVLWKGLGSAAALLLVFLVWFALGYLLMVLWDRLMRRK